MTEDLIKKLPIPKNKDLSLGSIETIGKPHLYCIGSKLVGWAADHWNGMLGQAAIEDAERNGIFCDICRLANKKDYNLPILKYNEHKSDKVLFLKIITKGRKPSEIRGLRAYLLSIKKKLIELNIDGVAFVKVD